MHPETASLVSNFSLYRGLLYRDPLICSVQNGGPTYACMSNSGIVYELTSNNQVQCSRTDNKVQEQKQLSLPFPTLNTTISFPLTPHSGKLTWTTPVYTAFAELRLLIPPSLPSPMLDWVALCMRYNVNSEFVWAEVMLPGTVSLYNWVLYRVLIYWSYSARKIHAACGSVPILLVT